LERLKPQPKVTFHNALFATDFSPASEAAFPYAVALADHYDSNLYVAHVINLESFDLISSDSVSTVLKQAHEEADRKMDRLLGPRRVQNDRYHSIVADGDIAEVLADMIQRNHVDLAVVGTHGRRAFKKLVLGSIAEEVFRTASCPVLTVGPRSAAAPPKIVLRHILYLLEFVPDSSEAAEYAVSLAEQYAANLTVMNVREDMRSSPEMRAMGEQITEPAKLWTEDHVPLDSNLRHKIHFERGFGPATEAILDFATKAAVDLIVMSVRRLDPVIAAHLPKPDVAYEVASRSPCPVLTIR
jgi:nucleotide-binding universal stress UspA family protein